MVGLCKNIGSRYLLSELVKIHFNLIRSIMAKFFQHCFEFNLSNLYSKFQTI